MAPDPPALAGRQSGSPRPRAPLQPHLEAVPEDWLHEYEHTEVARRLALLTADVDLLTRLALAGFAERHRQSLGEGGRMAAPPARLVAVVSALAVATAVIVVLAAAPAAACSCAGPFTDAEAAASAEAVFVGRQVGRRTLDSDVFSSSDPVVLTFAVSAVYKGSVAERQEVVTARHGASCGLEVFGSGDHLVFASGSARGEPQLGPGQLSANLCGGTRAVSDKPPAAALGRPQPPATATLRNQPPPPGAVTAYSDYRDDHATFWWIVAAFGFIAAGAGVRQVWARMTHR